MEDLVCALFRNGDVFTVPEESNCVGDDDSFFVCDLCFNPVFGSLLVLEIGEAIGEIGLQPVLPSNVLDRSFVVVGEELLDDIVGCFKDGILLSLCL